MYIHGYTNDRYSTLSKIMINAFKYRNDYNFLLCDWGKFSLNLYFSVVIPDLHEIGLEIAENLEKFFNFGYPVCSFHLIGHSLGAQVSGLIGRTLKEKDPKLELCRITGLDPAGPGFYKSARSATFKNFKHISSEDAKMVDVIHTNADLFGAVDRSGTADFFPNGGMNMPGCSINRACDHERAVEYFAESLKNPEAFVAVAATSFEAFQKGRYDKNDVTYMGIGCRKEFSLNNYFLNSFI